VTDAFASKFRHRQFFQGCHKRETAIIIRLIIAHERNHFALKLVNDPLSNLINFSCQFNCLLGKKREQKVHLSEEAPHSFFQVHFHVNKADEFSFAAFAFCHLQVEEALLAPDLVIKTSLRARYLDLIKLVN